MKNEKLPFDKKFRAELVAAAQAMGAGGLESTDFWKDFEQEVSRSAMKSERPQVEPRKLTVDKTASKRQ